MAMSFEALETPTFDIRGPREWIALRSVRLTWRAELIYAYGRPRPARDAALRWRVDGPEGPLQADIDPDARGRVALEAFTALPLERLLASLEARQRRVQAGRAPDAVPPLVDLEGGRELEAFLLTFGPLGVGWSSSFPVRNRAAEGLDHELQQAKQDLFVLRLGGDPASQPRVARRSRRWRVSFEGWAQGLAGRAPNVTEEADDDGEPEREWLPNLLRFQRQMLDTIELADLLARTQLTRDHARMESEVRRIRHALQDALLRPYNNRLERLGLDGRTEWRRTMPDVPRDVAVVNIEPDGARVPEQDGQLVAHLKAGHPFHGNEPCPFPHSRSRQARGWHVNWELFGRMVLADNIGRHLQWAHAYVEVDDRGNLAPTWRARSLVDVMTVQLMEHVVAAPPRHPGLLRPYWPLRTCDACGGVILARRGRGNMRQAGGVKGNRWHPGSCSHNGSERERRAAAAAGKGATSRRE